MAFFGAAAAAPQHPQAQQNPNPNQPASNTTPMTIDDFSVAFPALSQCSLVLDLAERLATKGEGYESRGEGIIFRAPVHSQKRSSSTNPTKPCPPIAARCRSSHVCALSPITRRRQGSEGRSAETLEGLVTGECRRAEQRPDQFSILDCLVGFRGTGRRRGRRRGRT